MHEGKPHTLGQNLWSARGYKVGDPWPGGSTGVDTTLGGNYSSFSNNLNNANNIIPETVLANNAGQGFDYSGLTKENWLDLGLGAGKDAWTGLNTKTGWNSLGSMLGGFGDLARGWAAIKGLGLTRDAMNLKQGNWEEEMKLAKTDYNNRAGSANEWISANDPSGTRQPWKTFNI